MKKSITAAAVAVWLAGVATSVYAQSSTPYEIASPTPNTVQPTATAPAPSSEDAQERQQFMQSHPNWASNNPQLAKFYKNHPEMANRAIDQYSARQWGQQHPQWVQNHPKLAKFDYNHPDWAETHAGQALGRGANGPGNGGSASSGMLASKGFGSAHRFGHGVGGRSFGHR